MRGRLDPVVFPVTSAGLGLPPVITNIGVTAVPPFPSITTAWIKITSNVAALSFPVQEVQLLGAGLYQPSGAYSVTSTAASTAIGNINATLTWSISLDSVNYYPFATTSHTVFTTFGAPQGFMGLPSALIPSRPHVTAARLNYAMSAASGHSSADALASTVLANTANTYLFNGLHSIGSANLWSYLASPSSIGFDFGSLSELALVQVLQAGVNAGMSFAYPVTASYNPGRFDAAAQQQAVIQGVAYTLHWYLHNGVSNMYEGYLFTPDTPTIPTTAYIVQVIRGSTIYVSSAITALSSTSNPALPSNLAPNGVNGNNPLAFTVIWQALRSEYHFNPSGPGGQLWYLSESANPVGPELFPIAY